MRGDEPLHLGAELVDEKGPAVADGPAGRRPDLVADPGGKGREGKSREDEVGMVEAMGGDDRLDLGGRAMDGDEPLVLECRR